MNISQVLINSLLAGSQLSMLALGLTSVHPIIGSFKQSIYYSDGSKRFVL